MKFKVNKAKFMLQLVEDRLIKTFNNFVHGSGLTHMTWVLQTRYFAFHGYNALAVDLPGHGLSGGESLKIN